MFVSSFVLIHKFPGSMKKHSLFKEVNMSPEAMAEKAQAVDSLLEGFTTNT